MFPFRTKPPARTAVGWEHLVIRPDTKLTAADKRRVEKAIRRAKKEGKIAKTAQQTIPYEEMYPDGICRITNRLYSKSVLCDDINYAEASDDEKAVLFELYCKLVNYFGPSVGFELSVICYPADLVEYRKMLALNPQGEQAPDAFMGGIEQMVSDLVAQYSAVKADTSLFQQREVIGKCPRCGSDVLEGKKNFFCSNRECQFSMWKDDRFFTSKHKELTKPMAAALLKNGRIKMKGLFSEKKGVLYDAVVVLADTGEKYVNYKIELSPRPKTKGKE